MKKFGFTLAEVLITLGIIGVVAALTAPALVQSAGTAKVGPTLSKVVATLENANEQLLHDEDATDLSKVLTDNDEDENTTLTDAYMDLLSKYIAGSSYDNDEITAASFEPALKSYNGKDASLTDGSRVFHFSDNIDVILDVNQIWAYNTKGSFKGNLATTYIDINGIKTKPNVQGKDVFYFNIDKSGQVLPWGGSTHAWLYGNENNKYTSEGDYACNENSVGTGRSCAGSIFDNNLKVIYQ